MFEWILAYFSSPPVCPVSADDREWLDCRFRWLIQEFGIERLREGTVVLPTTQFFAARYQATEDDIHRILVTVARYMDIDPDCLRLKYYQDGQVSWDGQRSSDTLGLYNESFDSGFYDIHLNVDQINDPLSVVATLAHEMGHVRLLGEDRVSPEEDEDHELLTDLITVFLGLGVCTANSVIREESWSTGTYGRWSIARGGYLSMNMYGYALGLYALARGEEKPPWMKYLRADVRKACRDTIRLKRMEEE